MKRLGNIWKDVTNVDLVVSDIIEGTKNKRGRRETQKLLYDSEIVTERPELWHQIDPAKASTYAEYLVNMLASGTWEHSHPKHRRQFCRNKTRMSINGVTPWLGRALQQ